MARSLLALFFLCIFFRDVVQGLSNEHGRIVGGEVAAAGEFPWQVSLRAPGRHFCGGSLVSLQHVLTAGHCVTGREASSIIVVTGTNSLSNGGEEHAVRTIYIHERYSSPAPAYHIADVAVLVLDAPIIESPLQRPIILPIMEAPDGAEAVVSGWGRSLPGNEALPTELQKISVTIINRTECLEQWDGVEILIDHLCAVQEYGAGVCNGDSGGALVYNNQVVGIVSWANPCGFDYPDVYTHVYAHLFWIGWHIYNTEIEDVSTPPSGNNQVSLSDGNYVLHIISVYAIAQILFLT